MRTSISEVKNSEGKELEFSGWVHGRRDHGKIIFIDLRDRTGLVQVVFTPQIKDAQELRLEYVIKISGLVKKRPDNVVNDKLVNGYLEVEAKELQILSIAEALPMPVDSDGYEIDEEIRMKYRYLDLRRERMKNNLLLRHKVTNSVRQYLNEHNFVEIETPMLTKTSP